MSVPEHRAESFFNRSAERVARELLGDWLLVEDDGEEVGGRIVETEAYVSEGDDANHALQSGKTERNQAMFGPPGTVYVYLIYGMYHCLNVVCCDTDVPEAVLIRALRPEEGVQQMVERRKKERSGPLPRHEIASGPGKLCMALDIDRAVDGSTVFGDDGLLICRGSTVDQEQVMIGPRIGVQYAETAGQWPLRYRVKESYRFDG